MVVFKDAKYINNTPCRSTLKLEINVIGNYGRLCPKLVILAPISELYAIEDAFDQIRITLFPALTINFLQTHAHSIHFHFPRLPILQVLTPNPSPSVPCICPSFAPATLPILYKAHHRAPVTDGETLALSTSLHPQCKINVLARRKANLVQLKNFTSRLLDIA